MSVSAAARLLLLTVICMLTVLWGCGRQLTAGRLLDLGVADGSKLTLVPAIEAGLAVSELLFP